MIANPFDSFPGSLAEKIDRTRLRMSLNAIMRDLWSEQLERLLGEARLLRGLGYPSPRDRETLAALDAGAHRGAEATRAASVEESAAPREEGSHGAQESLPEARAEPPSIER